MLLLLANSYAPRNYQANCYPFRQDSSWLYLLGTNIPDQAALIDIESAHATLFAEAPGLDTLIWTGPLPSPEECALSSACDAWKTLGELPSFLETLLAKKVPLFILPPYRSDQMLRLSGLLGIAPDKLDMLVEQRIISALVCVREIKSPQEIDEIEKAVSLTAEIHRDILHELRPGWTEQNAADRVAMRAASFGCSLSFQTIATCRGEVLHNSPTQRVVQAGDLFLLDAGVEVPSGYAGDLTTTFPVGPVFEPRARDLYRLLCNVLEAATGALGPGKRFIDIHRTASLALAEGLTALGLMKGDPREAVAEGAHALFFPHGLGHQIGLDVHDMEGLGEDIVGYGGELVRSTQFGLRSLRLAKTLKPGMVHSVEPGIYFIPDLIARWEAERLCQNYLDYATINKWKSVRGMRIEEDWCITGQGARRLGSMFDRSAESIEAARSAS